MKKLLVLVLCLVMLLSCAACGETPVDPGVEPGTPNNPGDVSNPSKDNGDAGAVKDSLSIATTIDYGTLDATSMGNKGFDPLVCVHETLWEVALDGTITPVLAESWEWPEDDHMVIHLKKDVTFSNGNPFTAHDVMFTLEATRDAGTAHTKPRVQTTDFERTKVRDDYTFDWYLNSPSIIHYSIAAQLLIMDEESYNPETAVTNPIGTGPYVVKEYVINSHSILERRDDYWGELPAIKNLTFRVLAEPAQRVNALETGLVDIAPVALSDVEYVDNLPGVKVRGRAGSWIYLGTNISSDGKLADPEARYAIFHAIDTNALSNLVYYGLGRSMVTPFTPAISEIDESMQGLGIYANGYDPELAKQLAEKTGLVGQTLTLANNGSAELIMASEMIKNMLAAIGVNVEIRSYDTASYADVKNDKTAYDILLSDGACTNMRLGDSFVNAIKNNKVWGIKEDWANGHGERYWEIMQQALSTMDDAKRADVNKELMTYYVETSPTMGLVEFDSYCAFPEDLNLDNYVDRVLYIYYARDYFFD